MFTNEIIVYYEILKVKPGSIEKWGVFIGIQGKCH